MFLSNGNRFLLQLGDIIKDNQYNMVFARNTFIVMISDFYVKHSNADNPNRFPDWFSINIANVKDSKSVHSNDKVWFTSSISNPVDSPVEKNNDNSIIDNWVILPNGYITGTPNNKSIKQSSTYTFKNRYSWTC